VVNEFFARLSRDCANLDFNSVGPMCAEDVYAFGAKSNVMQGR
jgi:hypothetical protein